MIRKKRNLTNEEQSLWNHVAQKIKPLEPEKRNAKPYPSKGQPLARSGVNLSLQKRAPLPLPPETNPFKNLPASASSTHRIKGVRNVKIEARLDLHGLTRSQAQLRLTQFLVSRQQQGCLWVLVITGKGLRNLEAEGSYEEDSRKTLRDLAPQWLEDPTLRSAVSAYTTAKPRDGGSGALYVRLKRLTREGSFSFSS